MTARPLALGAALAVLVAALAGAVCVLILKAPVEDAKQLVVILAVSGVGSFVVAAGLVRALGDRLSSLGLRFALAFGAGLAVTVVNVIGASWMMFLNSHDLALLLLVLAFSSIVSLAFGFSISAALVDKLGLVARSAGRLAAGDLSARIEAHGSDEVARLAAAFDHMADQLQSAFEREREVESSRRELVAAVSHDLRTPLATIRAMVEAMLDGVVSEPAEQRRYLTLVRGEVQHLSRLIDDLFELSQIESGALRLQLSPTRLGELLAQTLEAFEAQARDNGVVLVNQAAPGLPEIAADAARLQRVLRNLVDNALTYTPAGGAVRVDARADASGVRVSVSDTGPGIPPQDLERIFERFYRGERARSRTEHAGRRAGVGLGLAIARGIIHAHGGRMWAERGHGGGAVFHFTVPTGAATS